MKGQFFIPILIYSSPLPISSPIISQLNHTALSFSLAVLFQPEHC
jgi:hypothetical protein